MPKAYKATMNRKQAIRLAQDCMDAETWLDVACVLRRAAKRCGSIRKRGSWGYYLKRYAESIENGQHAIFPIFKSKGNNKLPFVAFSVLPLFTCPGAGECKQWCYSLMSWRYPGAYMRQLQNTLLIRRDRESIAQAFATIRPDRELRLYVDGDIENEGQLQYWFSLLRSRPDIKAYGYSKSWGVFLAYDRDPEALANMQALPITRGRFIAVQIDGDYPRGGARYSDRSYHAEVRQLARELTGETRVFSCPGRCGKCTRKQHACGDLQRFGNTLIAIGIHGGNQ